MRFIIILTLPLLLVSCNKDKSPGDFKIVETGLIGDIEDIVFVDDTLGFICGGKRGESGFIARTTDGGKTWNKQWLYFQDSKKVYDICFINDVNGFAASESNYYYRTVDGGLSWQVVWMDGSQLAYHVIHRPTVRKFDFPDSNKGYFVGGENYEVGVFYRSADGGTNWSFDTLNHELRGIDFISSSHGLIGGYGYLARTLDGGNTLEQLNLKNNFIVAIKMFSSEEIICISQNGGIFRSDDGGDSWESIRTENKILGKRYFFNDMAFINSTDGYICGANGVILKTIDSGKNWKEITSPVESELKHVSVFGNKVFIGTTNGRYLEF